MIDVQKLVVKKPRIVVPEHRISEGPGRTPSHRTTYEVAESEPQVRTIRVNFKHLGKQKSYKLSFPYLQFHLSVSSYPASQSLNVTMKNKSLEWGNKDVFQVPLPNLDSYMCVENGSYRGNMISAINFFWDSWFMPDWTPGLYLACKYFDGHLPSLEDTRSRNFRHYVDRSWETCLENWEKLNIDDVIKLDMTWHSKELYANNLHKDGGEWQTTLLKSNWTSYRG